MESPKKGSFLTKGQERLNYELIRRGFINISLIFGFCTADKSRLAIFEGMAFLFSGLLGLILAVILSLYDFKIFWIVGLIAIL